MVRRITLVLLTELRTRSFSHVSNEGALPGLEESERSETEVPALTRREPSVRDSMVNQPRHFRAYSLDEVMVAISHRDRCIGRGGFGLVFYGKTAGGVEVAVKINGKNSSQGATEFINEGFLLSKVHHRNLVSLLGYCDESEEQILIYEFMSRGTLSQHLYGQEKSCTLSWKDRLEIMVDAASGLEYLHNGCDPKIIHRDIKSSNILLDGKYAAKVADFGISKLFPGNETNSISTVVKGTIGYLDPEYLQTRRLTEKSDVYSFGVVLLEVICGRPANIRHPEDVNRQNIVEWVRRTLESRVKRLQPIVDPALAGTYSKEAMVRVVNLAMRCVEPGRANRPDMRAVLATLREALEHEKRKHELARRKQRKVTQIFSYFGMQNP